jgi:hypothetical protein
MWNIIWSCLVTIFVCTWISMHLNIPAPHEKWYTMVALRRLKGMVVALVAPELIIFWVVHQAIMACKLACKYNSVYILSYEFKIVDRCVKTL